MATWAATGGAMQYLSATTSLRCMPAPYFIRKDVFLPAMVAHCSARMRAFSGSCLMVIFSSPKKNALLQRRMLWENLKRRAMSAR